MTDTTLALLANTVRTLSIDAIQKANSGHPGLPLGAADFASVLWAKHLRFNPKDPTWAGRDRFVLSAGHGCMILYSLLHLFGYDVPLSEVQSFRQWESRTPGHPEFGVTPGVEATTGPLGQGAANAVGLALSAKMLRDRYSKDLFDYRVYALVSDGDLMEGLAYEAASLAGHWGLNNLIYLYDDNHISLAGETKVCFTESVAKRFEAFGWFVQQVNGHSAQEVDLALTKAKAETSRPSIICCRTTLGFGSPNKANTHDVHGAPLGDAELKATKENLKWPVEPRFHIPQETQALCAKIVEARTVEYSRWQENYRTWEGAEPQKAEQYKKQLAKTFPAELRAELVKTLGEIKKDATRNISGKAIQIIAKHMPGFVGGSADLDPSTKTAINGGGDVQRESYAGRNIRFGVREHAMGSIVNGLAYTKNWFPYTATFQVFADYMRPPIRLAALSHLQSLFIFTHDSFWVGEDGPTHEPIEQIASLRLIPNLCVFRPADGLEVALCYEAALSMKDRPSVFAFTRQNVTALERRADFKVEEILRGGYVVSGQDISDVVLVATGSEVGLAQDAAKLLSRKVRIVSMPCVEKFLQLSAAEQEAIIPAKARKISLEAGVTTGWERITGASGLNIGINHYGASAPGELLAEKFGFVPAAVKERIEKWL